MIVLRLDASGVPLAYSAMIFDGAKPYSGSSYNHSRVSVVGTESVGPNFVASSSRIGNVGSFDGSLVEAKKRFVTKSSALFVRITFPNWSISWIDTFNSGSVILICDLLRASRKPVVGYSNRLVRPFASVI